MPTRAQAPPAVPRLTYLRIKNYRALRDVEFRDLTPLTVLIGPNGSGKSTVLDALAFLAEAVSGNLEKAWDSRGRFRGMRTSGSDGRISFEMRFLLRNAESLQYEVIVNELDNKIYVADENLTSLGNDPVKLFSIYRSDSLPPAYEGFRQNFYEHDVTSKVSTSHSSHLLLANILSSYAPVDKLFQSALIVAEAIASYRYIHLPSHLEDQSDEGPRERLSKHGDNLPNVLHYLYLKHPETLARITTQLRRWVPGLADVVPEITSDERLILRFKDVPFEKPLRGKYMSGGTMRLVALLTLLYEPDAAGLLGIEEPENELHPQLLAYLAEELMAAAEQRQLLTATHSPALLNAMEPAQVWVLHRGADGYTQATRAADLPGIAAMVEEGSPLGYLWARNFFDVGNPLDLPAPIQ